MAVEQVSSLAQLYRHQLFPLAVARSIDVALFVVIVVISDRGWPLVLRNRLPLQMLEVAMAGSEQRPFADCVSVNVSDGDGGDAVKSRGA